MGVNTHPGNDLRAQVILHISRVSDKCIDRLSHFQSIIIFRVSV